MKILALEPYFGGSHKAFLNGWANNSTHQWTILTETDSKWKWRMRHSAVTFAKQIEQLCAQGQQWDVLFCSDMLNLAELSGLSPAAASLPKVAYFHENQLTYPNRFESDRDYQFVMTNYTTALAADEVWFNTRFHLEEFTTAMKQFLKRMPPPKLQSSVNSIIAKSKVYHPGIDTIEPSQKNNTARPICILWAARWEHDKNPELFFDALEILKTKGADFRLSVLGEQFTDSPQVFDFAKSHFVDHIDHWGYQKSRADYIQALAESDIVVSSADHEFFGISIVEAITAGAFPLLPHRLSYPEIIQMTSGSQDKRFLYDGTKENLAIKLFNLTENHAHGDLWQGANTLSNSAQKEFAWPIIAKRLDKGITNIVQSAK